MQSARRLHILSQTDERCGTGEPAAAACHYSAGMVAERDAV